MIVLKAVLVSRDKDYIRAWLDYVQSSSSGERMRFTAFSQWETFRDHMTEQEEHEMPDLIIAEPEFLNPWLMNGGEATGVSWLMLSEGADEGHETKRLMKYQPLPVLLEAVRNAGRQPRSKRNQRPGQETLAIAVLSASGGSGKTAVALHMAKQLGLAGYAVLYLNLETLDSSFPFLEKGLRQGSQRQHTDAEKGLSRLLYDLKAHRREVKGGQLQGQGLRNESGSTQERGTGLQAAMEYVVPHEALKSDVFWPLANRKEMLQMSKADTTDLIHYLANCGQYEVLILDGDSGWDERSNGILEAADTYVWLVEDDIAAMHRWGQWLQHAERTRADMLGSMLERTYFVINKYREQVMNPLPRPDLHVDAVLPYIPSWKQLNQEEVMLSSPIFQREVKKLCTLLVQGEGEEKQQTGHMIQQESWSL
ncbi:nucleotide-binding protein [Paenibacillus sp. TSA_86.1]|uniref:nucleotide-binding protein n=1 Tax=Paenibacillus sp. TSA_86.1 TaxID=3415649 RepID=UPI004045B184